MKPQTLTHAIAAMRALVRARHSGNAEQLRHAEFEVKEQGRYVFQVRQALVGNRDGVTLNNVTPGWVNARLTGKAEESA
ncbi:hypothetical protein I6Y99_005045 [Vibrio parahaemolyticus]|uniref:hypothetical protein n=1 Tax=Vibrio parahaemolyticus TaxID=670 RepID=UPI001A3353CC|nr:hypothetical protein [Vibrio parahaemolyticus]EGQ7796240.1 hypothetical protein [Vibrio parahaemolyticus]EGQ7810975.1 hypothetical protein [Vibrio parahaemolyticus]EHR5321358.1 hypothetical protein [Vibrio parahaemolyticus]EJB8691660.1 hypothetical protein [Vibrio parahaemolyticus]MCR9780641.1 hypothetical protein [Vibrio parahaemolyticus]